MGKIMTIWNDLIYLFSPPLCALCGEELVRGEKLICFRCLGNIPKTYFLQQADNPVRQLFEEEIPIVHALAFFHYQKDGSLQQLIHKIKYHKHKELALRMGRIVADEMADTEISRWIDLIVPVPLHPRRKRERGFNQSEWIAMGIAEILHKPIQTDALVRTVYNRPQVKQSSVQRRKNITDIFQLQDATALAGKHILLVDDVVTSGSTLKALARATLQAPDVHISVLTLGFA